MNTENNSNASADNAGSNRIPSPGDSDADVDTPPHDRAIGQSAQQQSAAREAARLAFWHRSYLDVARLAVRIGKWFMVGGAVVLAYLAILVIVHYTMPALSWLSDSELQQLEGFYSQTAVVFVPLSLITNAWLVAAYLRNRRAQ